MFTGIVTDIGVIEHVSEAADPRVRIGTAYDTATIALGASIACSGVCLTVVERGTGWFAVQVSGETQGRTATGQWSAGRRLNLERALRIGDELGGHIVTGHVDGVGTIADVRAAGDSRHLAVVAPAALAAFVAPKGSITLDGVSLTVNEVADEAEGTARFTLNIIPHTLAHTTLGELGPGDSVNLEIDILARYLQRMQARG